MLILVFTVFGVFGGFSTFSQADEGCYGESIMLPSHPFSPFYLKAVYFISKYGGQRKLMMDKGMPEDPRIKLSDQTFYLHNLTTEDNGYFVSSENVFLKVFNLEISDCAQKILKYYMDTLEYSVPKRARFLEFTPRMDSGDEPIILWNRTDRQSNDERRGKISGNIWRIYNLTQADDGYYSFRQKDNTLESRIHLAVEAPPMDGLPLHVGMEDSGTFDPQDNLNLTVQMAVKLEPNRALITYVGVSVGAALLCIGYCICCKKCCCKNDSPAPLTEAGPIGSYHDKTSETAASSAVYYHDVNPSSGPRCPTPVNPSVFPQQPTYQPVNIYPPQPGISVYPAQPGINVNHPQPGINVNPPQPGLDLYPAQPGINVNPPQPGINLNPPQPGLSMYSAQPGINVNPTQVVPPTDQGSAAAPTFSLEFLTSGPETGFELKGLSVPAAFPLSSETPSSDVYHSDKLNFL